MPDQHLRDGGGPQDPRDGLRADCSACFGLCCVVPAFAASADFAFDKAAGAACPNLRPDFGCSIHDRLGSAGFRGCVAYDCFGAGPKVSNVTFGSRDWRNGPEIARPMFAVFETMEALHELLWYLTEACERIPDGSMGAEIRTTLEGVEALASRDPEFLLSLDRKATRRDVDRVLVKVSALVRTGTRRAAPDFRGRDLSGRIFRQVDLRAANFRSALLIGADLTGADLSAADLIGADLRGARLDAADLGTSLFVTQSQIGGANGDSATRLPPALLRPDHWSTA